MTATADDDRHMHDHPFSFLSIILVGYYVEARPRFPIPVFKPSGREHFYIVVRKSWSVAYRRTTDRHIIVQVPPEGVWTLVFMSPKRQEWGFHTPSGKVHHSKYQSCHIHGEDS